MPLPVYRPLGVSAIAPAISEEVACVSSLPSPSLVVPKRLVVVPWPVEVLKMMSLASQELVESSAWLLPPGETCWLSWKLLVLSRQLPHLLPSSCVLKRSYRRQFFLLQFLLVLRGIGDVCNNGLQCHEEPHDVQQVVVQWSSLVGGLPASSSAECELLPRVRVHWYLVGQ